MNHIFKSLMIVTVLFLTGCITPQSASQPPEAKKFVNISDYRLDVGDKLEITVYNQEKLSGEFTVNTQGDIAMPLLENVPASGRTIQELELGIKDMLQPEYLNDPKVSIQVANYRNIYILGEVEKPGKYEYLPNMTLLQAIATAEGYTSRAAEDTATLRRHIGNRIDISEIDSDATLRAGDIIVIKRRWF